MAALIDAGLERAGYKVVKITDGIDDGDGDDEASWWPEIGEESGSPTGR